MAIARWPCPAAAWATLVAGAAAQDPCLLLVDGALGGVRVVGPGFHAGGAAVRAELAPGPWQLYFGPGAGGRPAPLPVDAPAGGFVHAAVAAAAGGDATRPLADSFRDGRIFGGEDARDVRVHVRARLAGPGQGAFGLVCRYEDDDHLYAFVYAPGSGELRLERRLGGAPLVLASARAPEQPEEWHELELQAEGFRLQAFCDDVPVAQVLDGALLEGRYGTFAAAGAAAEFADLTAAPPVHAVASAAAVTSAGRIDLVARAPAHVGGLYALCLRLDQPTALLPRMPSGFECFLLRAPREPLLLLGFGFGTVGPRGEIAGCLRWPLAPALRGEAALVGGLLGAPDGSAIDGRLPWTSTRFP